MQYTAAVGGASLHPAVVPMCGHQFKPGSLRGLVEALRRHLHDAVMSKRLLSCVR